ncbi:hypothetical protein GVAV_002868 [Gurleya vavrai]
MHNDAETDRFIIIFTNITIVFLIFEGIILRRNTAILQDSQKDPLILPKMYTILYTQSYCFLQAIRAVLYKNTGNAFVYFILQGLVLHRKITQTIEFGWSPLLIIQMFIFLAINIYFFYVTINLYFNSIWLNFKTIGANKKIINAYVVRQTYKALREAFFFYVVAITLYLITPGFFPGLAQEYRAWKLVFSFLILSTMINEDREIKISKIVSIITFLCVFLDILRRILQAMSKMNDGYTFDIYVASIIFFALLASIYDFLLYGSGLSEFLKNKREKKIEPVE